MPFTETWHTYLIYGKHYNRIPYGKNGGKVAAQCPGCKVNKNTLHRLGCPDEICPYCGAPATTCFCEAHDE